MATVYINGGNGDDVIDATASADPVQVQGRLGNDTITGSSFNDKLYGNEGNDVLAGGAGADTLGGATGADIYVISRADLGTGNDNILDFEGAGNGSASGDDVIHLTGFSADATFTFLSHSGDSHTYLISDGGVSSQVTIRYSGSATLVSGDYLFVGSTPGNSAPVLSGPQTPLANGSEDMAYGLTDASLLEGYSDPDGDALSITAIAADHGTLATTAGGYSLTPAANYSGPVTLTYTISDGRGGSLIGTRTLTLDAVNDAPALTGAQAPMVRGDVDADYAVTDAKLLEGFSDVDGDALTVTGLSASEGTLVANGSGYTLTPPAGFSGQITLTYSVSDGQGGLSPASRVVTFGGSNTDPVSETTAVATQTNQIVSGTLTASDADGDTVTFALVTGPANGTLKLAADGSYIYAPAVGYSGADAFTANLDDGHGGVTQATIAITVAESTADFSPYRDTSAAGALVFVQRDGTSGSFYVAAEMARVTRNGEVIADWTDAGVIFDIPQGDGYILETKTGGVTTIRPLAIGEVVVAAGQSNMEGWFTYAGSSHASEPGVYMWSASDDDEAGHWVDTTGAGAMAFADTLRLAEPGLPVAFITGAVGGTKLLPAGNVDYWLDTGDDTLYQNTIDQVIEAVHGHAGLLLWNQGEADSSSRPDPTVYADGLRTLFARFDADIAPERIVISGLAFTSGNADELRQAQASVAATSGGHVLYVPTTPAIETMDGTHLTVPARVLQGTEAALAVLAAQGVSLAEIVKAFGGASADSLAGTALIDIIQGGGGNDTLDGVVGDDIIRGEAGNDLITGGLGDDALSGGLDDDTVHGGDGNDDVFGDGGNDSLTGGIGTDQLDGGTGNDTMSGEAGNDAYVVDNAADVIIEAADGGIDTVYAKGSYTMAANLENLIIDSNDAVNATGNDLGNIMTGDNGANLLSGMGGNDSLNGGPGNDTLDGGDGNDTLSGVSGADLMMGGAGDDTYYVDAGDTITEASGAGFDTIISQITYVLPENVEAIVLGGKSTIGATGSSGNNSLTGNGNSNLLDGAAGNDTLIGNAGNDTLVGGLGHDTLQGNEGSDTIDGGEGSDALDGGISNDSLFGGARWDTLVGGDGNDTLDGGLDNDQMFGGLGSDVYYVDHIGDRVNESTTVNEGTDTVFASITWNMTSNVEAVTFTGTDNTSTLGNSLANTITGNTGNNTLVGGAGHDTIFGADGNDSLDGGIDSDVIDGGSGNDTVLGGQRWDTLTGGTGDDVLDGGTENDRMTGNTGNDTYYVDHIGDRVIEAFGEGTDTVYSSIDFALNADVENLFLTNSALSGTGNGLNNRITGNANANTLSGGNGNDTLAGGSGNDTVTGGAGRDDFVFSGPAGNGTDTIADFTHGLARLVFACADYGCAAGHVLTSAEFVAGAAAVGSGPQFVWDAVAGKLWWDADGSGAGAAVELAWMSGASVTKEDIGFI